MNTEELAAISAAAAKKAADAKSSPARYLTRAAIAGCFITVGALISCLCAAWFYADATGVAKLLGAVTFSAALILIVLLGGELFTGANLVVGIGLYDGKISPLDALRVWLYCYGGNLIGVLVICLLVVGSGASRDLLGSYLALIIPAKLSAPWYAIFLKGVLCNLLVCIGVYAGFRLKSESGKILVITLVITTFVMAGFEHSIANMAFFSLYALLVPGADFLAMGHNLLWSTLGNLLGGAVLLGLPLWFAGTPKIEKNP
ncbi:MAG: formate/nitrite transporter family protein [Oscillospiraceae bacterium]